MKNNLTALNWYDVICPFCYVAQQRNRILVQHGFHLIELPFQIHPDIPAGGIPAGSRTGPMYAMLEREAEEAGLPLRWPQHLPNTRRALAAAEWTRRRHPHAFPKLRGDLFAAHFALGEDLEDPNIIARHALEAGIDIDILNDALADGTAMRAVAEAETLGRKYSVNGTPAWQLGKQLISGLRPAAEFERFAEAPPRNCGDD